LEKVRASHASVEEYEELIDLIDSDETGDIIHRMDAFHNAERMPPMPYDITYWRAVMQEVLAAGKSIAPGAGEEEITLQAEQETPVHFLRPYRRWIVAAASIIILLGAGTYFFFVQQPARQVTVTPAVELKKDIPPGGNKAILTLADNSTIILDSAANGQLAAQGNSVVNKTKDGELTYAVSSSPSTGGGRGEALYNTLATPRGGQYQLMLPDGSKVWLNAASSIRYPTAFTGNERSVDITGEAYFEVAPVRLRSGQKKPFKVHFASAGREGVVEVLGTHFNINAYDDEPAVKTTLLEGAVKISKDAASVILKPGQQASISQSSKLSHPIPVQTDEVVAWKNGSFQFDRVPLSAVMRQLSRWYDVDVVYEKGVPDINLGGEMKRDLSLSQVLKGLGKMGVNYRIEGKKLVVLR
jgi:ferric-dicitrate binding protein FerR (iron transport regulator)